KDEASNMANARFELFQDAKNQLFYQVKNLYYQTFLLEEEISITEDNLDILKSLERLALIRFKNTGTQGQSPGNFQSPGSGTETPKSKSGNPMGNMEEGMNPGNNAGAA